ncbi:MAG: tetratricopeptide repeat protein [Desulfobacteraceae bacterium]|nr:tetratricopeptide repeat protein [Desulfobacteraceae bacterium]
MITNTLKFFLIGFLILAAACVSGKKDNAAKSATEPVSVEDETDREFTVDIFGDTVELFGDEERDEEPNGYFYYVESLFLKRRGNNDKSVHYLKEAISRDKESLYLQKELANLYLRMDDAKNAMMIVENILQKDPENLEALIITGGLNNRSKMSKAQKRLMNGFWIRTRLRKKYIRFWAVFIWMKMTETTHSAFIAEWQTAFPMPMWRIFISAKFILLRDVWAKRKKRSERLWNLKRIWKSRCSSWQISMNVREKPRKP